MNLLNNIRTELNSNNNSISINNLNQAYDKIIEYEETSRETLTIEDICQYTILYHQNINAFRNNIQGLITSYGMRKLHLYNRINNGINVTYSPNFFLIARDPLVKEFVISIRKNIANNISSNLVDEHLYQLAIRYLPEFANKTTAIEKKRFIKDKLRTEGFPLHQRGSPS